VFQTAAMPQPDAGRLLQPDDPPPFEIINRTAPAASC
jgi:hypothetical protein